MSVCMTCGRDGPAHTKAEGATCNATFRALLAAYGVPVGELVKP